MAPLSSRRSLASRLLAVPIVGTLLLSGLLLPARADVLTTAGGLRIEGKAARGDDGTWTVETANGTVSLPADRVADVKKGEGPRSRLARQRATLGADDANAWYRLALEADAAGLVDVADEAYREVARIQPEHAAARRALGHEKADGEWVDAAVVRRRRGLVLFRGRWMLPAEVEAAARVDAPVVAAPDNDARTREVIRTWATEAEPLRNAARVALAGVPRARRVRAALSTLFDADPKVRAASARLLGEIGDETALRPLIFSGARDVDRGVRREAVLAAASFGHDDVAIPYVRALASKQLRLAANAAEALALIGDQRALGYVVKRLTSHGSSTRNYVSFMNQVSYVRDYDVEIAQASNIANPDIATILDGVILDVRVLDASYTKTWIEPILLGAAGQLAGRSFDNRADLLQWYEGAQVTLPDFPEAPGAERKRRKQGTVLGAPMTR